MSTGLQREDVMLLAQLLDAMKEVTTELEKYYKKKDVEKFNSVKRELLELQRKVDNLL